MVGCVAVGAAAVPARGKDAHHPDEGDSRHKRHRVAADRSGDRSDATDTGHQQYGMPDTAHHHRDGSDGQGPVPVRHSRRWVVRYGTVRRTWTEYP